MSDPIDPWRAALDVLNNRGDARLLAKLLRNPGLDMPHAARCILAEMLDPRLGIHGEVLNVLLVPKRTNAAHKLMQKRFLQVKRAAQVRRHLEIGKKSVTDAVDDAAAELGLSSERLWQHWKAWRKEVPDYQPPQSRSTSSPRRARRSQ